MTSHVGFDDLFHASPIVMDGGLGTTLENELGSSVSRSHLWSAQAVVSSPEAVVQAHLRFLEAGARLISTSTYQCSRDTLTRAGFSEQESTNVMLQSVKLAHEARSRFQTHTTNTMHSGGTEQRHHLPPPPRIFVALSLGPFGATLRPTQEFKAFYPPPYGPREFTSSGLNENSFDCVEDELLAVDALAKFHLDRLTVFASDDGIWHYIDCIAFETVPLRREVTAIRKAMGFLQRKLVEEKPNHLLKPWWISCVFPNGESPEHAQPHRGTKVKIGALLDAAYKDANGDSLVIPSGFGINCTAMGYMRTLSTQVSDYFKAHQTSAKYRPWLVLYPNGSDVYDEEKESWIGTGHETQTEWAQALTRIAETEGTTQRLLIGGCCRTGPKEIAALDRSLKALNLGLGGANAG